MFRKFFSVIFVLAFLFITVSATPDSPIQSGLDDLDTSSWQEYINGIEQEFSKIGSWNDIPDLLAKIVSNDLQVDGTTVLKSVLDVFFSQIKELFPLIVSLCVVMMLCSVVKELDIIGGNGKNIAAIGGCAVFVLIVYTAFFSLVKSVSGSIGAINGFIELIMPPMTVLLASCGGTGSAGVLQPLSLLLTGTLSSFICGIVLPLLIAWSVVLLVNNVLQGSRLGQMAVFLQSSASWLLGGAFTLFVGLVTVKGFAASVSDGISVRGIKYALTTAIPIIGGSVSEGISVVLSSSLFIKSAIGICGMIIVAGIIFAPCIKIAAMLLFFRGLCACTPFADESMHRALSGVCDVLKVLCATTVGMGILYFVVLGLFAGAGSGLL